jgi:hypothetical protein
MLLSNIRKPLSEALTMTTGGTIMKAPGRHTYENRYCQPCKETTRHAISDHEQQGHLYTCMKCGSVKHLVKKQGDIHGWHGSQ